MTTTTRITLTDPALVADVDSSEDLERFLLLYAVTPDNLAPCEHCDDPIEPGLAVLVAQDADMAYPISMHLRHFDPADPDYVPFVAHLDLP